MGEAPGPVYQASKLSRGAAWLVLGCAAGVSVYGLMVATRRVPAETVRNELEQYWRSHRR